MVCTDKAAPTEKNSLQRARELLPSSLQRATPCVLVSSLSTPGHPSSRCDAAKRPGRATARRVGPHCAREGPYWCRLLEVLSEPTLGSAICNLSLRSISRPCTPSPPRFFRRSCACPISREASPWNISVRKQAGKPEYWELLPAESYSPQKATPGTPASRHAWRQNCSHEKTDALNHAGRPFLPLIPGGGR